MKVITAQVIPQVTVFLPLAGRKVLTQKITESLSILKALIMVRLQIVKVPCQRTRDARISLPNDRFLWALLTWPSAMKMEMQLKVAVSHSKASRARGEGKKGSHTKKIT